MNTFGKKSIGALALAVASITALAACSSSSSSNSSSSSGGGGSTNTGSGSIGLHGQFGQVPAMATGTQTAGTITMAEPPNSAPTWILPIVTGAAVTVYTVPMFDYQLYRPLYWLVNGVAPKETPAMSLANDPTWSNGNKTVTFTLKSNYKWSDGQPITSKDVLFWWYEMKAAIKASPANWAYYTPGLGVPDQVASISAPDSSTVQMNLTKAVNPTWFWQDQIGAIQPMPSHAWAKSSANGPALDFTKSANAAAIYSFLSAQSKSVSSYATNPLWQVVDGPYNLTSFDSTSGGFTMTPNAAYGGPHATTVSVLQAVPFTSDTAELNAVKAGKVDLGYVPLPDVPQVSSLSATYNEFGYSDFGWYYVAYNFKDPTGDFNNIIGQLYIRQTVAHLEDQAGYIKAFFNGAGGQAFGPVPSIPQSPFTPSNAMTNPYPYSLTTAENLLKSNGWSIVPNGTDTCIKPGTGPGECGAGIPAGTKLEWNLIYATSPAVIGEQVQDLASRARKIGMTMNLSSSNLNYMVANYNDPSSPKTISKWAMEDFGGFNNSTYPTTFGVFNSQGSNNLGGYTDPQADTLITASIDSPAASAVTAEASYLTTQQPGLFQPNPDSAFGTSAILVWTKTLSGTPESFEALTQASWNPEYMFFTK
jgi:peptide/nickel transport system substrate-binding protein